MTAQPIPNVKDLTFEFATRRGIPPLLCMGLFSGFLDDALHGARRL